MRFGKLFVCLLPVLLLVSGAFAQNNAISTVPENSPYVSYIHGTGVDGTYNASAQVFSMSGSASIIYFPARTSFCSPNIHPNCPTPTLSVAVQMDNNGNLVGGNPVSGQPDLVVTGQITNGSVTYTSPLLTGSVTQFFYDGVNDTSNFTFRFAVTGGSMASLYLNPPSLDNDLWMTLNVETVLGSTDFTGSFASSWGGEIKGNVYSTPGQCFGTIGDFVWNDLNGNGIQDAGEPGLDGVTVNLYDYQGNLLQTAVTKPGPTGSQLGYYQFTGVCAGTYTVKVDETTLPKGSNGKIDFAETTVNAPGSTTANDSNPNPSTVTLATNDSSDETIDFGYVSLQGAIGDYVWFDANGNGLQDAGEPGINGVVVDLYDSTQTNLLATTTTAYGGPNNVNGYYQFTGLSAGNYVVVVDSSTLPAGYLPTTPFIGSNSAIDSNGSPAAVNLPTDSSVNETIDFGYVTPCNGVIGDFVWHDLNLNGIQDTGEPGISGVTLDLYDSTYTLVQTAITNGSGNYLFSGLCAGSYEVDVVGSTLPPNFTPTTPQSFGSTTANDSNGSPAPVVLTTDSSNNVVSDLTIDFGYVSPCTGAIGDFVWYDQNGNGIQDADEPGIANVTVSLFDSQNHLLNQTTTNQVGYYQFTGLCAGTYFVQVTPPAGYSPTIVNAPGSTPANDSNPNPSTVVLSITDSNGDITNDETIDFGFVLPQLSVSCASVTTGEVGVPFDSGPMTVSGGLAPYTFSIVGTLPAGLSLNTTTGEVSGTPAGSGSFTVQVADAIGEVSTGCSITISTSLLVSCGSVTAGEVGVSFNSGPMTVSGGTAPYTFSVVGTLPAGLTLNTTTGAVTGTPTASGTFSVQVKDALGATSSGCAITISTSLVVSCGSVTAGEVGVSFNSGPMTVSGGTAPYTFSVVGTLPAGLTLNTTTGAVTGTPSVAGTFSVQVKDALGATSSGCAITISTSLLVSCGSVTAGEVGVSFNSGPMTVSGGTAPYTYSVVGTLPAGLTLNTTTGAVTGTPSAAGTFSVQVKDALGATSTGCAITISTSLLVSCGSVTAGEVGVSFNSGPMTVSGGTAPYTYSVVGTLPAGLMLNTTNGAVTGTPTAAGTFSVQVKDALGATSSGCAITISTSLVVSCGSVTAGEVGVSFNSGPMTVSGGTGPYTYSVVGTLPAGLTLNTTTGAVTGSPTASGSFKVQVKDALGATSSGCAITISTSLLVSCGSVSAGEVGVSFNSGPMTVSGGTAPYTYSVVGTLPAGLTLNTTTGAVTGTPTASGSFKVQVKDALGATSSGCAITISASLVVSCGSASAGKVGVSFNSGPMTMSGGTAPYTYSVVGTLPAGLTLNTTTGAVTGTPTVAGTFSVQVKDALGATSSGCAITISTSLLVSCGSVSAGEVGVSFNSGSMTVSGGTAPYLFSVVGTLPAGLTLNTTTGAVTGTPKASGSFSIKVTDAKGATSSGCAITISTVLTVSCGSVTAGEVGVSFNSGPMTVSGGTGPYTYSVVGTLPAGLTLNTTTGAVTGTPTAAGSFKVQVKDALGTTNCGCPITISASLVVSCGSVTAGEVGVSFNSGPMTVSGGTGPYTYSVVGTLPAGLTLNTATGAVTGTPKASGSFSIKVTDAKGVSSTGTCAITVAPAPSPIACGDTATIGFWNNNNGQALIDGLNGGPTAKNLATWLATNFPYLYGVNSSHNLTGKTNADVAALFKTFFNVTGTKTNAQILAGALATYVTNSNLGGSSIAAGYGFKVSSSGTGGKSYNVGTNGTAIGLVNNTSYTILQLMQQVNLQMQAGTFNATIFNTIFNAINTTGDIAG